MVLLFAVGAISRSERSSAPRLWRSSLRTETRSALALGLDCPFPGPRTAAFGAARAGCQRGSRWRRIPRPGGVSSASAGVWWTTVPISAVGSSIRANIWEHARCDRSGRLARSGLRRVVDLMLASALLPNTERGHGSARFVGSVTSSSWDVHFYPRAGIAVGVLFSVDCLTLIWPSHRSPKVLQVVPGPLGQHDSSALG